MESTVKQIRKPNKNQKENFNLNLNRLQHRTSTPISNYAPNGLGPDRLNLYPFGGRRTLPARRIMDEASRLILELQGKLAALDHKIWLYRRDMAVEFIKYVEETLRHVPDDVSATVARAVAASMHEYKNLDADSTLATESWPPAANSSKNEHESSLDHDMEEPVRSPHAREQEFHGLFTPTYLPLLDSSSSYDDRRSSISSVASPPAHQTEPVMLSVYPSNTGEPSLTPAAPDLPRPVVPVRRNTDELSFASDVSDNLVRRSALRRSSSTSKPQSPRRVRFDFAGEEVLPTASPVFMANLDQAKSLPLNLDSAVAGESVLEQAEDGDELPPKRISSSQALRALSKGPLEDDGLGWTTVSAPPDGSASVAGSNGHAHDGSDDELEMASSRYQAASVSTNAQVGDSNPDSKIPIPIPIPHTHDAQPVEARASTESHTIDIASQEPAEASHNSPPPTTESSQIENSLEPKKIVHDQLDGSTPLKFEEEDHDEYFLFDEPEDSRPPPEDDEDEEESEPTQPESSSEAKTSEALLSQYSRSPAVAISAKFASMEVSKTEPTPKSPSPEDRAPLSPSTAPGPWKGVVGSYKGRPFSMPIVSEEIHAQAASLGAINSFVGSVDGRSGIDESDIQSFMASGGIGSFTGGTPMLMSERLMMDDLKEAAEEIEKFSAGQESLRRP